MPHNKQNKIAVINDFCGFGRCALTVALPIISAMGVQCCPMPTSIFSNHTAYDSFYYTDFTEHMNAYMDEWKHLNLRFDGILTGFLGSVEQICIVERFMELFKESRTVTVVDPIMGDNGKLYATYSPTLAKEMVTLVKYADILTPNLTEACILTDTEYSEDMPDDRLKEICLRLSENGPEKIVISGLSRKNDLANFVFDAKQGAEIITRPRVGPCRSGTGDVFSAIITADAVRGADFSDSVIHATDFIGKVLKRTVEMDLSPEDGVCFEEFLNEL